MNHGTLKKLANRYDDELMALDTYDENMQDVRLDILRDQLSLIFLTAPDGYALYYQCEGITDLRTENMDSVFRYRLTKTDTARFLSMKGAFFGYVYHGSEVLTRGAGLRLDVDVGFLVIDTQFESLETGRMYPPMRPSIMAYPEYQRVQPSLEEVAASLKEATAFFDQQLAILDFRLVNCLNDLCFIGQSANHGHFYMNFYECYEVKLTRTTEHQRTKLQVAPQEGPYQHPLWHITLTYDHLHITALVNGVEWKVLPDYIQSLDEEYFKES